MSLQQDSVIERKGYACWMVLCCFVGVTGCHHPEAGEDSTLLDAGVDSSAPFDGSPPPDGGLTDVQLPDASQPDTSVEDAGPADVTMPDVGFPDVGFEYDPVDAGSLNDATACAQDSVLAEPAPLDLYVMLDRSGSMNLPYAMPTDDQTPGGGDCDAGESKTSRWCATINALAEFFTTESSDVQVALQFFPESSCRVSSNPFVFDCCNSGACCNGDSLSTAAVPLGALPDHGAALTSALNQEVPWGDRTPIEAALRGMVSFTAQNQVPERRMAGVLITDGGPEGCISNSTALASIVESHRRATGIRTYTVGMDGADFAALNEIAAAGGAAPHTDFCHGSAARCRYYDVGHGGGDALSAVMERIQRVALGCQYKLPKPEAGLVNPALASLRYDTAAGDVVLERVQSSSECADGGFYYDDNQTPTTLTVCPASCSELAAEATTVEVLLGCEGS